MTFLEDQPEWEVSVVNRFQAEDAEDAVRQMVEWLINSARIAGYRVDRVGSADTVFIDAEGIL